MNINQFSVDVSLEHGFLNCLRLKLEGRVG